MNFFQKLRDFLASPSYSRTAGVLIILILLAAIPLTVIVSQKQQETRQHAATPCAAPNFSVTTAGNAILMQITSPSADATLYRYEWCPTGVTWGSANCGYTTNPEPKAAAIGPPIGASYDYRARVETASSCLAPGDFSAAQSAVLPNLKDLIPPPTPTAIPTPTPTVTPTPTLVPIPTVTPAPWPGAECDVNIYTDSSCNSTSFTHNHFGCSLNNNAYVSQINKCLPNGTGSLQVTACTACYPSSTSRPTNTGMIQGQYLDSSGNLLVLPGQRISLGNGLSTTASPEWSFTGLTTGGTYDIIADNIPGYTITIAACRNCTKQTGNSATVSITPDTGNLAIVSFTYTLTSQITPTATPIPSCIQLNAVNSLARRYLTGDTSVTLQAVNSLARQYIQNPCP